MRFPRLTTRRLMVLVAATAVVMGGFIEIPLMYHHWKFCRERADEHADEWRSCTRHEQEVLRKTCRLTTIARRLAGMGPAEKRDIASIVRESGDPSFAGWFFTPGKLQLLYGSRDDPKDYGGPVFPIEVANYLESNWGNWWREEARQRARIAAYHAEMHWKYLRAASRPWLPVPPDPPPP